MQQDVGAVAVAQVEGGPEQKAGEWEIPKEVADVQEEEASLVVCGFRTYINPSIG